MSIQRRREVVGFTQDDPASMSSCPAARHSEPSTSSGAMGDAAWCANGRHRLPGLGPDDQLPDRRGRDERGAGDRHAPGGWRHRPRQPGGGNPYGVVLLEKEIEHTGEPTMQDLRETLVAAYGTDYGVHSPS